MRVKYLKFTVYFIQKSTFYIAAYSKKKKKKKRKEMREAEIPTHDRLICSLTLLDATVSIGLVP